MKRVAALVPVLTFCLAACNPSGTDPGPVKSCRERSVGLLQEVAEFRDAHPPQDPHITTVLPYPLVVEGPNGDGSHQGNGDSFWIQPVGFDPVTGDVASFPLMDTASNGIETSSPSMKPAETSLVLVISEGGYIAKVRIFDSANRLVRETIQSFGYRGELANMNRMVPEGFVSFLVWNSRGRDGGLAPDGAYLWRISFQFKDGTEYQVEAKTGVFTTLCPAE